MARYKLLQAAYINNAMYGEDSIVEVGDDFEPGPHMVPVDAAAKKKAREIGLQNKPVSDFVDAMTGGPDVRAYGASPQVASGVLAGPPEQAVNDMMGAEMIRSA